MDLINTDTCFFFTVFQVRVSCDVAGHLYATSGEALTYLCIYSSVSPGCELICIGTWQIMNVSPTAHSYERKEQIRNEEVWEVGKEITSSFGLIFAIHCDFISSSSVKCFRLVYILSGLKDRLLQFWC